MTAHDHVLIAGSIGGRLTIALVGSHPVALESFIEGSIAVIGIASLSTKVGHVHAAALIKLCGGTSVLMRDLSSG